MREAGEADKWQEPWIIAHLERFIWMPGNKKMIQSLLEPVTVQINAESFLEWKHRRASRCSVTERRIFWEVTVMGAHQGTGSS